MFNQPGRLTDHGPRRAWPAYYATTPFTGTVTVTQDATTATVPLQTGLVFASNSGFGYVDRLSNGAYTVNGSPDVPVLRLDDSARQRPTR